MNRRKIAAAAASLDSAAAAFAREVELEARGIGHAAAVVGVHVVPHLPGKPWYGVSITCAQDQPIMVEGRSTDLAEAARQALRGLPLRIRLSKRRRREGAP